MTKRFEYPRNQRKYMDGMMGHTKRDLIVDLICISIMNVDVIH